MRKICLLHKYKEFDDGDKLCIKCGKHKMELWMRYYTFKLTSSCWFWKIRGLQSCPHHGFYNQSWINGYCKECKRKEWTKDEIKKAEESKESYY